MKLAIVYGVIGSILLAACQGCGTGVPTPTSISVGVSDAGIVTCVTVKPVIAADGAVIGAAIVNQ